MEIATTSILIKRPDGGVAIMQIVTAAPAHFFPAIMAERANFKRHKKTGDWTVTLTREYIDTEIAKAGIECQSWSKIKPNTVPNDIASRAYRNAWGHDMRVDMTKARGIHRERMRNLRTPKLAALDVEQLRAQGDEKRLAEVLAAKQALRDVTADPSIEAAKTPMELLAVLPDALKE